MKTATSFILAVLLCLPSTLRAADATAPAAAPTSAPAPPRKVTIPTGFKVVTVNNRKAICEPADEAWVATALGKAQATTRPSTRPTQIVAKLMEQRTPLLQQLARDLALADLTAPAAQYDKDLVAAEKSLEAYKPDVYYLVITPDRLAAIIKAGWSDPHFYYNRAADSVQFNPAGSMPLDRPQDDVLFPAPYDTDDAPEKRGDGLAATVGSTEALMLAYLEIKGRTTVGATFAQMANEYGVKPLALKEDQQWFGLGIASILSAKYAAAITQEQAADLMDTLTMEHPANPLKTSAIDLLRPQDPNLMRDEAKPAYYDAVRRKSARAVRELMDKGGEQALPKAIMEIRTSKPADGPALVEAIKKATGVDLTPKLVRGS
jgi:hypothetical protein